MASSLPMRSWSCLRSAVRGIYQLQGPSRSLSSISLTTKYTPKPEPKELPKNLPPHFYSQLPHRMRPDMGMTVAVSILPNVFLSFPLPLLEFFQELTVDSQTENEDQARTTLNAERLSRSRRCSD